MTAVLALLGLLVLVIIGTAIYSAREGQRDRFAAQRQLRAAYIRADQRPPSYL